MCIREKQTEEKPRMDERQIPSKGDKRFHYEDYENIQEQIQIRKKTSH